MQGRRKWGAEGALAPPIFGQTVNPISTRGTDYAHHSTLSPPPRISRPCNGPLTVNTFRLPKFSTDSNELRLFSSLNKQWL